MGRRVGHHVVPDAGDDPAEWEGSEVAALIDLGGADMVGFTAEGLVWDGDQPRQGLHLKHREYVVARAGRRRRGGRPADRGRRQPDPAVGNVAVAAAHARRRRAADLRVGSGRARGRSPRGRGAVLRHARAHGNSSTWCRPTSRNALGGVRRARVGVRRDRRRRRCRFGGRARRARARAREAGRTGRAPRERGRSRAHRHRVAVADPRDEAQVRAHVRQRAAADGGLSRVPVLGVAGAAVRVDEGALPAALRTHARAGRRPGASSRSAACGSRPTATSRRASRSCARSCTASASSSTSSARDDRPLAPRRVRLLRRAPADPEGSRHHVVPDAEDVVERDQPVPAQHVLVGGHRRHARSSRTSRPPTRTTAT